MRLYHQYFRQKNPGTSRAPLRGSKKDVYAILTANSGSRRKNPPETEAVHYKNLSRRIDWWNLLGRLNRYIENGETGFISVRDVVKAKLEGYLAGEALDYSFEHTIRDLSAAQVNLLRKMIDESGGSLTLEGESISQGVARRRAIDAQIDRDPKVRALQKRVDAFESRNQELTASARRNRVGGHELNRGSYGAAYMAEHERAANEELGYATAYYPANVKAYNEALALAKRERPDLISTPDTPDSERKRRARLLRDLRIKIYEQPAPKGFGGREASKGDIRLRKATAKKELGVPFRVDSGTLGIITGTPSGYSWSFMDDRGRPYFSGTAPTSNAASREITIAHRVTSDIISLDARNPENAAWHDLPINDTRWLDEHLPEISPSIANILVDLVLNNNFSKRSLSKKLSDNINRYSSLKSAKPSLSRVSDDMEKACENMQPRDRLEFQGPGGKYTIVVDKTSGGNYIYFVVTSDGRESMHRRTDKCADIVSRGHITGGAMVGARAVTGAISNPAKLQRLHKSAEKYFESRPKPKTTRKRNPPKLPRQSADEGDIRDLTGMISIPESPEAAYRYGYYAGIIRGIDTCGVQNYLKRKRIREEYQDKLLSASAEATARLTGTRSGYVAKNKNRSAYQTESYYGSEADLPETFADKVRARVARKIRAKTADDIKAEAEMAQREKDEAARAIRAGKKPKKASKDGVLKDLRDSIADAVSGKGKRKAKPTSERTRGRSIGEIEPVYDVEITEDNEWA